MKNFMNTFEILIMSMKILFFFFLIFKINVDEFRLGDNQIRNLRKIRAFVSNSILRDTRQSEIRARCLEYWEVRIFLFFNKIKKSFIINLKLPDEPRQKPKRLNYNDIQANLFYQVINIFFCLFFVVKEFFNYLAW